MNESSHPELDHFFGAYLNQDYDLSGETIEEIVKCYKQATPSAAHVKMSLEIEKFKTTNPQLDKAFEKAYGSDFSPKLWGHTVTSFLDELSRLLSE